MVDEVGGEQAAEVMWGKTDACQLGVIDCEGVAELRELVTEGARTCRSGSPTGHRAGPE